MFDVSESKERTFEKIQYFRFDYGEHLVRFLGESERIYTHYIPGKATVKCLGYDECPICQNNRKLMAENPDNYSDIKGFNPYSERHYVNVLDRTPVKVCPECQENVKANSNGKFPPACPECSTIITDRPVAPMNKVKVMNLSKTLATKVNALSQRVLDPDGEPSDFRAYDWAFLVIKAGKKKDISPTAVSENNDSVDVNDDALYDLDNAVIVLSATEIVELLKGVSLRDIFLGRRSDKVEDAFEGVEESVKKEVDDLVSELMGD